MKVTSTEPFSGETVYVVEYTNSFDQGETECIRYSANNWSVNNGMDTYTVTDCTKLEAAYQAFKRAAVL